MNDFDKLKQFILSWEGGYVNHPKDPGGPTNKGITIATFRAAFGQGKTIQDLKNMTNDQWSYIFRKYFWDRWRADSIKDSNLKYLLVDWVWASGKYGITKVQQYLETNPDGIVGNKTLSALNAIPPKTAFQDIWKIRESFIKSLKTYSTFGNGWMRRLNSIQYGKLITNKGTIL